MANVERLMLVAKFLRENEENIRETFSLLYWRRVDRAGKVMSCAVGQATPLFAHLGFRLCIDAAVTGIKTYLPHFQGGRGVNAVRALFDITFDEFLCLFTTLGPDHDPSPSEVATRIEEFCSAQTQR